MEELGKHLTEFTKLIASDGVDQIRKLLLNLEDLSSLRNFLQVYIF